MKTLKWFSLEWDGIFGEIDLMISEVSDMPLVSFKTSGNKTAEQQAFDWLEVNGYIERIK